MHFIQKLLFCYLIVERNFSRILGVEYYKEKPDFLPSCKINEPGFTKCSTDSVQKLVDQLIIGIPEITESFGPFDPMHVRDIQINQDDSEVANLRVNLTNVVVKGFSKTHVKQNKVSKKDYTWETKIFLPKMRIDANYKMKGRILLIPLQGNGKLFMEIENLDIILYKKTHLYDRDGFTFINVTGVHVLLNTTRVRAHLDNLFKNKEIEESTNEFFNENWHELYNAFKPIVIETVENILFDVMQKVLNLIPAKFFIEDIPTAEQLYGK